MRKRSGRTEREVSRAMAPPSLVPRQVEDIRRVIRHGDELIRLVTDAGTDDETAVRLAELLDGIEQDGFGWLMPLMLLDRRYSEETGYDQAMSDCDQLTEDERLQFADLQGKLTVSADQIMRKAQMVLAVAFEGKNRWGTRIVQRRIDLETGVPLMRVTVRPAGEGEEDIFDTEESTHAFIRNATGLLYSVAETYQQCVDHKREVPAYVKRKDEWAVGKALQMLRKLCDALDMDFNELAAEPTDDEDVEGAVPSGQ